MPYRVVIHRSCVVPFHVARCPRTGQIGVGCRLPLQAGPVNWPWPWAVPHTGAVRLAGGWSILSLAYDALPSDGIKGI